MLNKEHQWKKHDLPYTYSTFLFGFGIEPSLSLFSLFRCTNHICISPASTLYFIEKMEYERSAEALEGSDTIPDVVGSMSQLQ